MWRYSLKPPKTPRKASLPSAFAPPKVPSTEPGWSVAAAPLPKNAPPHSPSKEVPPPVVERPREEAAVGTTGSLFDSCRSQIHRQPVECSNRSGTVFILEAKIGNSTSDGSQGGAITEVGRQTDIAFEVVDIICGI